jgi:hypothetical protein
VLEMTAGPIAWFHLASADSAPLIAEAPDCLIQPAGPPRLTSWTMKLLPSGSAKVRNDS